MQNYFFSKLIMRHEGCFIIIITVVAGVVQGIKIVLPSDNKNKIYVTSPDRIDFNLFRLSFASHTGQIHAAFKCLLREQTRHKLIAFEGLAKPSKINSAMKWWSKRISMVIAKTASRNKRRLQGG